LDNPLVSVIIPTYNSEKTLAKCLESIKNQTYKNIEVIVVDRFSGDGTAKLAEDYVSRVFFLDAGRTEAKNFGASKSRGGYAFFIDSDMELTERVVQECVEFLEMDPKIGGIIVSERSMGDSFWVRVRDFERSFYAGTEIESARFFRRSLVEKSGGFDEGLVFFEESTLPQKVEGLGYDVKARINAEILHHEDDFSLLRWLKKKYGYGKSGWNYRQKYGAYGKKQMNLLYRFGLFLKERRFYSKPILATGVLTLKLLESLSAGSGFLINMVRK
jgi:glycosyltransferase involved in cell wall biosynthesis